MALNSCCVTTLTHSPQAKAVILLQLSFTFSFTCVCNKSALYKFMHENLSENISQRCAARLVLQDFSSKKAAVLALCQHISKPIFGSYLTEKWHTKVFGKMVNGFSWKATVYEKQFVLYRCNYKIKDGLCGRKKHCEPIHMRRLQLQLKAIQKNDAWKNSASSISSDKNNQKHRGALSSLMSIGVFHLWEGGAPQRFTCSSLQKAPVNHRRRLSSP